MKILAIETSCDETSVAVVEDGRRALSNAVASQIKAHQKYGGVVPELASRMHAEKIHKIIEIALKESGDTFDSIEAIAVTVGPGLEGALLVGYAVAKTLARTLNRPLILVNHLHGHIYAPYLGTEAPEFPFVTLIVSGGHTELVYVSDHFEFQLMGSTRDDACGECFDKVGRILGLPYPGGPAIEKAALEGNPKAFSFPRAMRKHLDFSFSGLKTAVSQKVAQLDTVHVSDVCASFQAAVMDTLFEKSVMACEAKNVRSLVVTGGVSANTAIRERFLSLEKRGYKVFIPKFEYATDNAAMIGAAAFFQFQRVGASVEVGTVCPNLEVETLYAV